MLRTVASLDASVLPILITLTYPGEWTKEPTRWKRDLDYFGKALTKAVPGVSMIWKLEPQQRGAPHYHGMIFGAEWIDMDWLGFVWWTIVGSQCLLHRDAGTKVERAKSRRAAMAYMSKKYLGKIITLPAGWENVGRFWGVIGRKYLPVSREFSIITSTDAAFRYRRLIRRKLERKGKVKMGLMTFSLYTSDPLQWARALVWASGERYDFAELGTEAACGRVRIRQDDSPGTQA